MKTVRLILMFSGMAFVLLILAPQDRLDSIKKYWLRFINDPGQVCLDFERNNLKDPESAHLLNAVSSDDFTVEITYSAKNSYGASAVDSVKCGLARGKIDSDRTAMLRYTDRLTAEIKVLDAKNKCLTRRNELMLGSKNMTAAQADREIGGPCNR